MSCENLFSMFILQMFCLILRLETIDGTAEAVSDYVPLKTTIEFAAYETLKEINIEIVDDDIWEPDEIFFAKLFLDHDGAHAHNVTLGNVSINQITIINDDGELVEYLKFSMTINTLISGLGTREEPWYSLCLVSVSLRARRIN